MANKVTTVSYLKTKSGKDVSEHGEFQAFSGRGESLGTQSATKEIAGDMGECSIGDNGNENGDEAKDKAAELSRTVKPVQESTPQQVDEEPNKGDVSQSQSNSKTPVCSNQSTSRTTENVAIAADMAACSIDDNGNDNSIEANNEAAELRTVKPVLETTPQQVDKEANKGDVGQPQSNSKTSVCSKQSTSQTTVDWQFYLDTLAPRISKELDSLATYLGIPKTKLENIRKDYKTEHERCFHLLWAWCLQSVGDDDDERLTVLRNALVEAGLKILAEEEMKTRQMYTFEGGIRDDETTFIEAIEIRKVAEMLGNVHARLGRYFQLDEEEITRVINKWNSESIEQANEIIATCIDKGLLSTRQELCNGLNYVENKKLIEHMKNKYWST